MVCISLYIRISSTYSIQLLNILIDTFIGCIPIVGDLYVICRWFRLPESSFSLDLAFTSNLRNLALLETHLKKDGKFKVTIPPPGSFHPTDAQSSGSFLGRLFGLQPKDARDKYRRKKAR